METARGLVLPPLPSLPLSDGFSAVCSQYPGTLGPTRPPHSIPAPWPQPLFPPGNDGVMSAWEGLLSIIVLCPQQAPPLHKSIGWSSDTCWPSLPAVQGWQHHGVFRGWLFRDEPFTYPSPGTKHILAQRMKTLGGHHWPGTGWAGPETGDWLGHVALVWQLTDLLSPALTGCDPRPPVESAWGFPPLREHDRK